MALCYYSGKSNRFNQFWGNHVMLINIQDCIIQFCRKTFGKKYKNYWIDVVCFDDKYIKHTSDFFSEVHIDLYPKITNVKKELQKYAKDGFNIKDSEVVRGIVYEIANYDIYENKEKGIKPIHIIIKGVRFNTGKKSKNGRNIYKQRITSVNKVNKF